MAVWGINKQGKKRRVRHGVALMPSCHACTAAAVLGEKALKRRTLAAVFFDNNDDVAYKLHSLPLRPYLAAPQGKAGQAPTSLQPPRRGG